MSVDGSSRCWTRTSSRLLGRLLVRQQNAGFSAAPLIDAAVEAAALPSVTVGTHVAHARAAAVSISVSVVPTVVRQWAMPEMMMMAVMVMTMMVVAMMVTMVAMVTVAVAVMSTSANHLDHGLIVHGRL